MSLTSQLHLVGKKRRAFVALLSADSDLQR